jgi:hypothetical protein
MATQEELRIAETGKGDRRLALRIVITLGDVLHQEGALVGDAVVLATRTALVDAFTLKGFTGPDAHPRGPVHRHRGSPGVLRLLRDGQHHGGGDDPRPAARAGRRRRAPVRRRDAPQRRRLVLPHVPRAGDCHRGRRRAGRGMDAAARPGRALPPEHGRPPRRAVRLPRLPAQPRSERRERGGAGLQPARPGRGDRARHRTGATAARRRRLGGAARRADVPEPGARLAGVELYRLGPRTR